MTKDDIKLLCETDLQLQWWAMVLFAEIVAAVEAEPNATDKTLADYVRLKVAEWPRIIIGHQITKAKEKEKANAITPES